MDFRCLRRLSLGVGHCNARWGQPHPNQRTLHFLGVALGRLLLFGQGCGVSVGGRNGDDREFRIRATFNSRTDRLGELLFIVDVWLVVTDQNQQTTNRRRDADIGVIGRNTGRSG